MSDNADRLTALKRRYEKLKSKKDQATALHEKASDDLDELKRKAMEQFKTDDLEELKKLLESKQNENNEMLHKYEEYCSDIEKALEALESNEES